jgi:hypothetical protein
MPGFGKKRQARAAVAAAAAVAAVAAAAWFAAPSALAGDGHRDAALNEQFAGVFTFHACPASAPPGGFCLTDVLTGDLPGVGAVTGTFEVDIENGSTGADGCAPIVKHGSFTTADGSLIDIDASGVFCNASGIASYRYTVNGGTGPYRAARGHGIWLVPPATAFTATGGNGPEVFFGTFDAR